MSSAAVVRVPIERFMRGIDHVQELDGDGPPREVVHSEVDGSALYLHLPAIVVTGDADRGYEPILVLALDATFGDVRRLLDAMTPDDRDALRLKERLRANDHIAVEQMLRDNRFTETRLLSYFLKLNPRFTQAYVEMRLPIMFF